jgi:hypothetical protein
VAIVGIILLLVLLVPILGLVIDSPIGRAIARRIEGQPPEAVPDLPELRRKVDLLEGEVEDLQRTVESLREEQAFLQRLLEDPPRPPLPPAPRP